MDIACPAVLGQESSGATVHVDDGLLGGLPSSVDAVVKVLETKYKVQVSDAVSKPGDSLKFLKKDLTVTSEGLVVSLDHKYIDRVCDLVGVVNPKRRKIPCSQEILSDDNSPELPVEQASKFRGAIGSLLYVSPERPDVQFAIACLARCMSKPTQKAWQQLYVLAEYLWHTKHYELTLKWTYPGRSMLDERLLSTAEIAQKQISCANEPMLIEIFTDSDWAGAVDRISTSSCHVFVNGNLAYAFVRKQGCISLSSCEAELVAAVSGAAEGLYVAHTIRTAGSCSTKIVLRMDSSSARALLFKQGVSRVRHLDTKLLWLQDYSRRKLLEPAAVNTLHNTADLGTKPLSNKRIAFLMNKIGFNVECDAVQTIKNSTHAKLVKKAVATILMLTMIPESNALSLTQDTNDMLGDFYLIFFTSHPYTILSIMVGLVSLIGLTIYMCIPSSTPQNGPHHQPRDQHGQDGPHHQPRDQHGQDGPHHQPRDQQGQDGPHQPQDQHGQDGPHQPQDQHGHDGTHQPRDQRGDDEHGVGHRDDQPGAQRNHGFRVRNIGPIAWPDLRFCPRAGTSYHRPGCGNLLSSNNVAIYTRERHQQAPLAQCQVCNPPLLPNSAPVKTRRRRR